jgi:hypothetical protein
LPCDSPTSGAKWIGKPPSKGVDDDHQNVRAHVARAVCRHRGARAETEAKVFAYVTKTTGFCADEFCSRVRFVTVVLFVLLMARIGVTCAGEPLRVIYPHSESESDERPSYPLAVLRLVLERNPGAFLLRPSAAPMQQSRSLLLLEQGDQLDVAWTVTDEAREAKLRPIRFPIDFGLIGWRVLLVKRGDDRFAGIDSVAALARLVAGQGHDWPDVSILRDNGLQVTTSSTYDGLFAMLVRGHIDYFPRALSEAVEEINTHAQLPIELERHVLIHYPSPLYFFVHPHNDALAVALEQGLERRLADGSLKVLFDAHYARDISAIGVRSRQLLELKNPDLPKGTPLERHELWIDPVQ